MGTRADDARTLAFSGRRGEIQQLKPVTEDILSRNIGEKMNTASRGVESLMESITEVSIFGGALPLLFGFALFHAIAQDRRKFGPIGWNIAYAFTKEDFDVCQKQLKLFLDEYDAIPYKVLNFLGSEINYGGRVTDDKDVRLIKCML